MNPNFLQSAGNDPANMHFANLLSAYTAQLSMHGANPASATAVPQNALMAQLMAQSVPQFNSHGFSTPHNPLTNDQHPRSAQGLNVPAQNHSNIAGPSSRSAEVPPKLSAPTSSVPQAQNHTLPQMLIQGMPQVFPHMPARDMMGMPGMMQPPEAQFTALVAKLMSEAYKIAAPIGTSPDDETRLIQVLAESESKGQTFRQALETLHGVNDHTATLWKDYYLDHSPRLDMLIAKRKELAAARRSQLGIASSSSISGHVRPSHGPPSNTTPSRLQKSTPLARPTGVSHSDARVAHDHIVPNVRSPSFPRLSSSHGQNGQRRSDNPGPASTKTKGKQRVSRGGTAANHVSLYPERWTVQIPKAPSSSPTPPTRVEIAPRGNRYTTEDKEYFIKFIQWRLMKDPTLEKEELCALLAEKVPSHSAQSWATRWNRENELPDKILELARKRAQSPSIVNLITDDSESEKDSGDDYLIEASKLAAKPIERPSSETETEHEFDTDDVASDADTEDDLRNMGRMHELFTSADLRIMARHVASHPNWDSMSRSERWVEFASKHPRSSESYAERYKKDKKKIDRLALRYTNEAPVSSKSTPSGSRSASALEKGKGRDMETPPSESSRTQKRGAEDAHLSDEVQADKRPRMETDA